MIFLLLGLLFLKFSVLLILIVFLFTSTSTLNERIVELEQNVQRLNERRITCPSCESGWLEFQDHCYFFSNFTLNWTQAEEMCREKGSHLVVITSQAEQDFILSHYNNNEYWIGLTDLEKEGTFKWVDGTPLSYTFWKAGEPNNLITEDCAHVSTNGKWNDNFCHWKLHALCEKRMI